MCIYTHGYAKCMTKSIHIIFLLLCDFLKVQNAAERTSYCLDNVDYLFSVPNTLQISPCIKSVTRQVSILCLSPNLSVQRMFNNVSIPTEVDQKSMAQLMFNMLC